MEPLSLCIAAGVVLFYQRLLQPPIPDRSEYTEGVVGNYAIMTLPVSNGVNFNMRSLNWVLRSSPVSASS